MSRTYALKKLLEHGPLSTREIMEIMGGGESARWAIDNLLKSGVVVRRSRWSKGSIYALRG